MSDCGLDFYHEPILKLSKLFRFLNKGKKNGQGNAQICYRDCDSARSAGIDWLADEEQSEDYAASMPQDVVTETMTVEEMPMMPEQVEPDMSAGTTEE